MAYAATDRPAWKEVVIVVAACAVLLVVLTRLDRAAYEASMARARKAIAAQRAEAPVDRGPVALPVGGTWSAAPAPRAGVLRRIVGPTAAADRVPDLAVVTRDLPSAPPTAAVTAAPAGPRPRTDLVGVFLAGVGVALMATGGVLVGRGR